MRDDNNSPGGVLAYGAVLVVVSWSKTRSNSYPDHILPQTTGRIQESSCAHTTRKRPTDKTLRQYTMCKLAVTDAQHAPRGGGGVAAVPGESESQASRTGPYVRIINHHQPNSSQHTRKAPQGSSFLPPGPGSHRVRFRGPCGQEILGHGEGEGEGHSPLVEPSSWHAALARHALP